MSPQERVLAERLSRVERQVRLLAILAVLAPLAVVVLAAAPNDPDVVRAQAIVLLDQRGEERGSWRTGPDGSILQLLDASGTERVTLWHDTSATGLHLRDGNADPRVGLAHFAHGGSGVALHGEHVRGAAVLYHAAGRGSLTFYDTTGTVLDRIAPEP